MPTEADRIHMEMWADAEPINDGEPYGLDLAVKAVAKGDDIDYVTFHGLTHREVIKEYVRMRSEA